MCGIVGVVGNTNATDILIQGLEKLEYRGYDSAGIFVLGGAENHLVKAVGRIAELSAKTAGVEGTTGIGHTRWATHGKPTEDNAHPHRSETERFVLVHNGVIENYLEIKEEYLAGHHFKGQTDTEIAVHLIGKFAEEDGLSVLEAFKKALHIIRGSYAFALVDSQDPEVIYVAKNKSPLLIGLGEGYNMVCSDAMAMIRETNQYMEIHDQELVIVKADSVEVQDYDGNSRERASYTAELDLSDIGKGTYPYYMLKEIDEQPTVMRKLIQAYTDEVGQVVVDPAIIQAVQDADRIYILTAGKNLTGDKSIEKLAPNMNEAWLDQEHKVFSYEPQPAGTIRVNYYRTDGNYDKKSLWYWGDVKNPSSGEWPNGTDFTATGKYGRYIDIPLKDAAKDLGFLLLDRNKQGDDVKIRKEDYKFTDLKNHSQIFLKDDDESIYTNPYYVHDIRMTGAQHVGTSSIESSFSTLVGAKKEDILKHSNITNHLGNKVAITDVAIDEAGKKVTYSGDFSDTKHPYTVSYNADQFTTKTSWRLKDETYSYDGKLGADLKEEGKQVDLTLWSPSADKVSVVVYDKNDPDKVVGTVALEKGEKGTWKQTLDSTNKLGITDFTGYYYQYQIERQGKTVLALDPYAKSLAAWNSDDAKIDDAHKVAKAAFVNPAKLGPQDLTYGKIHNFKTREDAVIYEAHVRDFTSDPACK